MCTSYACRFALAVTFLVCLAATLMPASAQTPDGPVATAAVMADNLGAMNITSRDLPVLYDQTDNLGAFGFASQKFEPNFEAYDNQGADDFVVPAGTAWVIGEVVAPGKYNEGGGPTPLVNVYFYADDDGRPGTEVASVIGFDGALADPDGSGVLTIPVNVILAEGTYWVSVQPEMPFNPLGQWFWLPRATVSGAVSHWRNPGDAMETGCVDWQERLAVCEIGYEDTGADAGFALFGYAYAGVTTIAEARAAGPGSTVTVVGTVSRALGNFTYFQDHTAGLVVRQTSGDFHDDVASSTIAAGNPILVRGELSDFEGLMQINQGHLTLHRVGSRGAEPEPVTVTLQEIEGDAFQAQVVHVKDVSVVNGQGVFAEATTYDVTDPSIAPEPIALWIPAAGDTELAGEPIPTSEFDFTGVVGHFQEPQLVAIRESDIDRKPVSSGGETSHGDIVVAQNFPNPFATRTTIEFSLPEPVAVRVEVFDLTGRRVAILADGDFPAGPHALTWDAAGIASGVYVMRIQAGSVMQSLRTSIVR